MAFRPLELVKSHPVATGVVVFIIGVILVLMFSGGSRETGTTTVIGNGVDPSTVAANSALVQGQLAAGVANQQTAAELSLGMAAIAGRNKEIELSYANDASRIAQESTLTLATLNAQKDTQNLVSTLSAQVSQAQISAGQAATFSNNATAIQIAQVNADARKQTEAFMASVQTSQIKSQEELTRIAAARDVTLSAQQAALVSSIYTTQAQRDMALATTQSNRDTTLASTEAASKSQLEAQRAAETIRLREIQASLDHSRLYQEAVQSDRAAQFQHAQLFQNAEANFRLFQLNQQLLNKAA